MVKREISPGGLFCWVFAAGRLFIPTNLQTSLQIVTPPCRDTHKSVTCII